jgi:mycothiol synthase
LAQKASLTPGRTLLQLRVELPLSESVVAATKNIATQSFKVGIDDEEWIALNNRAFADHPEQGGWTKQILESRQSEKWFDAEGFLMHYINTTDSIAKHELAGFCWTKIDRDSDPLLGEIYVIAVDPRHHNKGLGRSLTVAGLNHLATAGAATGMLFVDKDNIAAISTYLKLGFTTHHQEQAFVGDIN